MSIVSCEASIGWLNLSIGISQTFLFTESWDDFVVFYVWNFSLGRSSNLRGIKP